MSLRKGKTKSTLEKSIEASLLAVEIYNKPRAPFKVEGFITQMIMAWTRLFHAHFNNTIGDKYCYKKPNGRYELIDGERKSWELKTCITKFKKLDEAVKSNLLFFIKLRNKIEHRHIDRDEIGIMIFGECQSLLYNYESQLIDFFGEDYALNESLAFSLQFSRIRKKKQIENKDFFDFFKDKEINENDFIFLDPPYDTEFSTYDKNNFGLSDQKRLADLLINQLNCNWMVIIKNTEFIHELYDNNEEIFINYFDKKYAVSFMNRNVREAEHLMITNYEISQFTINNPTLFTQTS